MDMHIYTHVYIYICHPCLDPGFGDVAPGPSHFQSRLQPETSRLTQEKSGGSRVKNGGLMWFSSLGLELFIVLQPRLA